MSRRKTNERRNTLEIPSPAHLITQPQKIRRADMGLLAKAVRKYGVAVARMEEEVNRPPLASTSTPQDTIVEPAASEAAPASSGSGQGSVGGKEAPRRYSKVELPSQEQMMMDDMMNNCMVKMVLSCVMGGVLGGAMGIFFGAFEPMQPGEEKLGIMQSIKNYGRQSLSKSWSYAKGFAAFGALYSGSECVIEQTRAKHDIYNSAYAGCFTGGVMARSGGKEAMAMGCATMGALSVAMDRFMDIH